VVEQEVVRVRHLDPFGHVTIVLSNPNAGVCGGAAAPRGENR
jgi:hypothetical protein